MTGYKYRPWMYVMVFETFSMQTGFTPNPWVLCRVVEFFERIHRSVDLREYRQPCIMSSIMRWI
jgi:hypothetical protein